ncbi:uncharacterized protein LOC144945431 [Lampetra fluviatilis]
MMMALLLEALLSTGALFLRVYEAACFVLELHFALVSTLLQALRLLLGLPGAALGLVTSGAAGLLSASCRAACGGLALLRGLGLDCLGALVALPGATAEAALAAGRLPASAALGLAGGLRAAAEALGNAGAAFVAAVGSTGSAVGGAVVATANAVGGAVVATGSVVTNAVEATASGAIASAMSAVGAVTDTLSGAVAATGGAFATLLNAAGSVIGWSVEVAAGSVAYTLGLATGALGAASAVATASLSAAVDFWLFALRLPLHLLTISFGAVATAVTLQGLFVSVALIGLSVWYLSPQPRRRAAVVYARVPRPRLRLSAALRVAFANLTGMIRTALRRTAQGRHRQRLDVYPAPVPARIDAPRPEPLPEPLPTEPVPDERHEAEEAAAAVAARERLRGEAARNGSGEAAVMRQQPWEQQEFPRQEEDKEDDNHKSCVICQDQAKGTVLLPCRHLCLCSACARTIMRGPFNQQKCPLCRKMIVHTMDVFM